MKYEQVKNKKDVIDTRRFSELSQAEMRSLEIEHQARTMEALAEEFPGVPEERGSGGAVLRSAVPSIYEQRAKAYREEAGVVAARIKELRQVVDDPEALGDGKKAWFDSRLARLEEAHILVTDRIENPTLYGLAEGEDPGSQREQREIEVAIEKLKELRNQPSSTRAGPAPKG